MNKVPLRPADLPNSRIWLGPDLFKMIDERSPHFPAGVVLLQPLVPRQVGGIEKLAIDIELHLS
jgi:hypothetical protein